MDRVRTNNFLDNTMSTECRPLQLRHSLSLFLHSWSTCSPDLKACDFFLWGYLKKKTVFQADPPTTIQALKRLIVDETTSILRRNVVNYLTFLFYNTGD